jgi:hypothetical protein
MRSRVGFYSEFRGIVHLAKRRKIRLGECIESIACEEGFTPERIWLDDANAELRGIRNNPHVLQPGDELVIPDKQRKQIAMSTGRRHVVRRRGVPARFRVVLESDGLPRPDVAFVLRVGGVEHLGVTTALGEIEAWIPPDAVRAELIISDVEIYHFELGHLLPVTHEAGVRARLENLGYEVSYPEDADEEDHARRLRKALRRFQRDHDLAPSGKADEATQMALLGAHGS